MSPKKQEALVRRYLAHTGGKVTDAQFHRFAKGIGTRPEKAEEIVFRLAASKTAGFREDVYIPKREFVREHKRLLKVLKSPSRKDDREEFRRQKQELKQKTAACASALDYIRSAL